jgi:hypothetical protein
MGDNSEAARRGKRPSGFAAIAGFAGRYGMVHGGQGFERLSDLAGARARAMSAVGR